LALRPGVDPDEATADVRRVLGTTLADQEGGAFVLVRDTREDVARVERAILPQVSALLIASALVAAVALVLSTQAAGRLVRSTETELRSYRAMGAARLQLALIGVGPSLVAIAGGIVLAVGFAWLVSPVSPLGALHRVEPSPGTSFDAVAILGGTLALAVVTAAGASLAAVAAARRLRTTTGQRIQRPSQVVRLLHRTSAPPEVIAGARAALVPEPGWGSAPIRSITIGTVVATAALVAALCFGASLDRLVDEPPLYGWNWDVALVDDGGYGDIDPERADALLSADPDVDGWAGIGVSSTDIDGRTVPLVGIDTRSGVSPAILSGRAPRADDEIAVGRQTLRQLGVSEGDLVTYGPGRTRLRVVGTVSLPAIGQVRSSHASPGEGALVTIATLGGAVGAGDEGLPAGMTIAAIDLRDGVDVEAASRRLEEAASELGSYPGSMGVTGVPRPAEIVNAGDVTVAPTLMAGVLMAAALVSLGLALVGNVRRRRNELATLRALGFTRRQLVASVLTQSVLVTALGVAVGVPLGVLAGRWAWGAFADRLSVVDQPVTPVPQLVVMVGLIVVVALVASIVPARIAGRVRVLDHRAAT
jgi:ABC-type lipoprotein release transport system permease subunit